MQVVYSYPLLHLDVDPGAIEAMNTHNISFTERYIGNKNTKAKQTTNMHYASHIERPQDINGVLH